MHNIKLKFSSYGCWYLAASQLAVRLQTEIIAVSLPQLISFHTDCLFHLNQTSRGSALLFINIFHFSFPIVGVRHHFQHTRFWCNVFICHSSFNLCSFHKPVLWFWERLSTLFNFNGWYWMPRTFFFSCEGVDVGGGGGEQTVSGGLANNFQYSNQILLQPMSSFCLFPCYYSMVFYGCCFYY